MGFWKRIFRWLFGSDRDDSGEGTGSGDDPRSRRPDPDGSTPPDTNYPLF